MTRPAWVAPQLATLVSGPPPGDDWVHEIKLDGYRILLRIERGRVELLTRNRLDWTARFPTVAAAAAALPVKEALLDGEIVVPGRGRRLELPGAPAGLRPDRGGPVARLRGVRSAVPRRARPACPAAGRAESAAGPAGQGPARPAALLGALRRGRAWLKVKCVARQELVIGGYTDPEGARAWRDHWEKSAHSLLTGAILHVLYAGDPLVEDGLLPPLQFGHLILITTQGAEIGIGLDGKGVMSLSDQGDLQRSTTDTPCPE